MSDIESSEAEHAVTTLVVRDARLGRREQLAEAHYLKIATAIVLIGFLARVAVAVLYANVNPATANTWEYGYIAVASLKYGGIVSSMTRPDGSVFVFPTAFVPPVPIFLWIGLFKLFGVSKTALAIMIGMNVAGGTAVVAYTMRIARLLFRSSLVALIAGAIMALHPVFVYSVATYEQLNIYILMLLVIFDLASSRYAPTPSRSVAIGILLAAAVLVRTEYLALGVAIVIGSFARHRRFRLALLSLVVAFLFAVPWTIRNYVVFHRFIPVADSLGYNLFKGFNPEANGSGHWVDRADVAEKLLGAKLAAVPLTKMNEVQRDDVYRTAAEKFIASHPVDAFAILPLEKVLLFWLFDIHDPTTYELLYQLQFWPILVLSVLGLAYAVRKRLFRDPDQRMLGIMFAMETLVMAAYAVHARYRMNVEPFLFGYAALGALVGWAWLRARLPEQLSRSAALRSPPP